MASTGEEPTVSTAVESSPSVPMEAKLTLSSSHADCQKLKDLLSKENATPMVAVMAFSKGKEPSSSAAGAKAPGLAMDATLMVSTGHGECQKLKNLLNKKDAKITMVVTASCDQDSEAKPSLNSLQLRLLAAASAGDLEELKSLLNRTGDVEEGNNVAASSASAASLLEGSVTMEGDTALHLVAANGAKGGSEKFKSCAEFIHEKDKDINLLYKKNKKGDTPLHCAVRVGKFQLVSCLIRLAKDDGKVQDLLRMENKNNETALHEAVRRGDNKMVKELLKADPELAFFPTNGTSPLYLAIQLIDDRAILLKEDKQARNERSDELSKKDEEKSMAQTLHDESKDGFLSYLGPNGQNALHAAVLRGPVLTRKLLRWNEDLNKRWHKDLTVQRDENGSTPLHFAAGLLGAHRRGSVCSQVFGANSDALYQLDNDGLSPIHVAASVGEYSDGLSPIFKKCPGSAGLRDAKGRTFLHVAVENEQVPTVSFACTNSQQAWILNMQDNDGNTALHLAVKAGSLPMFSALFGNRKVDLNIANEEGQTPLDIAHYKLPTWLSYNQNSEALICRTLGMAGARRGASRRDHYFRKKFQDIHGLKSEQESKESENLKDVTQSLSITSVLIATVAFGATFALPGGYRADDHTNGGTPTLAGRYAFDAFLMANTLAFIFSAAAIICIARAGSPAYNRHSRTIHAAISFYLVEISVTCLLAAFALGVFAVLSPVAHKTAVAICVMSLLVLLCKNADVWVKWFILAPSSWVRMGRVLTFCFGIGGFVASMFQQFWPFLLIFIWAAYGRTHPISKVEPPAQPPSSV